MARRQILTASFWSRLMAPPLGDREVAMHCTLTPDEVEAVARKRTALNDEQIAELREKRARGTLIKDLMAEYSLSKATIYRYLGKIEA